MAEFNTKGFDEVEKELLKQSEIATKAVPLMLEAGGEVLVDAYKEEIEKSYGISPRSKGDLKKSIKKSKVFSTSVEATITIAPEGKDSKGVRNAEKGFILEYGRGQGRRAAKSSKKTGRIAPTRWMERSNAKSEDKVHETMVKVWEGMNDGN